MLAVHAVRLSAALVSLLSASALAADPARVLGQNASVIASGNTVLISRLPVVTASGSVVYREVTLTLDTTDTGDVSVGAAKGVPSVDVSSVNAFHAGLYAAKNPSGPPFMVRVSGPSVAPGGLSVWSLTANAGGDQCSFPLSASWYAGPLAANPLKPRLDTLKFTSPVYSYGTIGGMPCGFQGWPDAGIMTAQQSGDGLTLSSIGPDGSAVHTISYLLVPGK